MIFCMSMALNSPYPPANVARVPSPNDAGLVSGVLVPRATGYLTIQVMFHGRAQAGLKVRFYKLKDDGSEGDAVGEEQETDSGGVVGVDHLVTAGVYGCAIENQPATEVATVHDIKERAPVVLPIGRPFVDVLEDHEFEPSGEA
jgi:hypothetical protein